ncbi:NAD-dependent epimerase/dehydratase family protein [Kitasatospora sp. GAS204B]|uniref:NAD-dependent epimerase/dehydratase family protein n=1 Tax=unclassified Kitasatospora TaxID=2633591 RepID=UPI0024730A55|nr:NAD-dependent epimerase/dehydratase family protein [Kitasatospora sp. GAS204B]MDH6118040.1 2'-hydroxyisoflavone reductase [Kitasatospora sp. GAS204B]
MRILVLGGTWFLGKAVVDGALARGWEVSTFSRGRSGLPAAQAQHIAGDRLAPEDLRRLASHGPWDAVIDTSSTELSPRGVLLSTTELRDQVRHWVHISTVSVYQGWPHRKLTEDSPVLDCPPDADETFGYTGPDGSPTIYGFQKAGGERAVTSVFGADAVTLLRPGVILGPGEYVGRLPWWLSRAARGGNILAPAPPDRKVQPVDVRDVATFALDRADVAEGDIFNVTHPQGITFGGFVAECLRVTEGAGQPVWVDDRLLIEHGVTEWTELPLWRTHQGVWSVDSTRAVGAGMRFRSIAQTIADTWAWLDAGGELVDHPRRHVHGISEEKEASVLASTAGRSPS